MPLIRKLRMTRFEPLSPAPPTKPALRGGFFCAWRTAMTRSDILALIIPTIPPLLLAMTKLSAEVRHWLRRRDEHR